MHFPNADSYFDSETSFFSPVYIAPTFFFSCGSCLLLIGLGLLIKNHFSCQNA